MLIDNQNERLHVYNIVHHDVYNMLHPCDKWECGAKFWLESYFEGTI